MATDTFAQWLEGELARRGWKASDLAREAGINQGTLSNILNGVRGVGLDFCVRVASALRVPPELVLRQAGLLPQLPEASPLADEMAYLFGQLPPPDQERAVAIMRTLLRTAEGQSLGTDAEEARYDAVTPDLDVEWDTVEEWNTATGVAPYRTAAPLAEGRRALPRRTRKTVIYALGAILIVALIAVVAVAFAQGSWWYANPSARALDRSARAQVQAVRDELKESGAAPEALVWLDAALAPDARPTDVRLYLMSARDLIQELDTVDALRLAEQLSAAINSIGPAAATPFAVSTAPAQD